MKRLTLLLLLSLTSLSMGDISPNPVAETPGYAVIGAVSLAAAVLLIGRRLLHKKE